MDLIDHVNSKKAKCAKCSWPHGGFHICVDLTTPEPKIKTRARGQMGAANESTRRALAQSVSERWERYREETRDRDERMIERYKTDGVGYVKLAEEFGISRTTVAKIIQKAASEGRVVIRRRGHTFAKGAR